MAFISILALPPSAHSLRINVKVRNRMAICLAIAGLLIGGARLSPTPPTGGERTSLGMQDGVAPVRFRQARASEPRRSRAAPGLRNARPATRLAIGPAVAWSGAL